MLSIFGSPSRYVQGREATRALGDEIKRLGLGKCAFVLASRSARRLLDQTWADTFKQSDIRYCLFEFGGECSREEINRAKEAAVTAGAEIIVGAGGGKALDTSRAVAADLNLPAVNCPTTASSDAPCSALSVVYTPDGEFESYIFYRKNPELVLVDTSVIAKAPARLLIAGMGDALATWFEAQTVAQAKKRNQIGGATTSTASALARLCYDTLLNDGVAALHAVQRQSVTPALERLVEANTLLSGLGFESGGLAIAHSVHNGLTIAPQTHNFYHGEKVAFGLIVQLVAEGKQTTLLNEVLQFCVSVGLPITLESIGIAEMSRPLLTAVAQRATAEGETAHNEPFTVTPELIADAIATADAIGRDFIGRQSVQRHSVCV